MSFFSIKKKKGVLDLTRYREKPESKQVNTSASSTSSSSSENAFSFFDLGAANSKTSDAEIENESGYESPHERKRKLAKRLMTITDKLEELSNQIYHLQQRVELLERKLEVNRN